MKTFKPIPNATCSLFEIQDPFDADEYHIFHIAYNKNSVAVGGVTNCGFFPTFWIDHDKDFSLDEHLETIYEILLEAIYAGEIDELKGLIEL